MNQMLIDDLGNCLPSKKKDLTKTMILSKNNHFEESLFEDRISVNFVEDHYTEF